MKHQVQKTLAISLLILVCLAMLSTTAFAVTDGVTGYFVGSEVYIGPSFYFAAGNITIGAVTSNELANGQFDVWLHNAGTGANSEKLHLLQNGSSTATWYNMPAGTYYVYMQMSTPDTIQYYDIIIARSE